LARTGRLTIARRHEQLDAFDSLLHRSQLKSERTLMRRFRRLEPGAAVREGLNQMAIS
jgi:hypothetical protein